jgi:hypothetical protein
MHEFGQIKLFSARHASPWMTLLRYKVLRKNSGDCIFGSALVDFCRKIEKFM